MNNRQHILANEDIAEITLAVPEGHRHLRARISLFSGQEIVLQEATIANLVRAYIGIKTHPVTHSCQMIGQRMDPGATKQGYATWQLLEKD